MRLLLWVVALGMWGCGATQSSPVGPRGTVRFDCTPQEAQLVVDETRLGPVGMFKKQGLLLRPGQHRVILHAPNYLRAYQLVEVKKDQLVVVKIDLRPVP